MNKIVYLPLDERPCNLGYTSAVSEGNGRFRLVSPKLCEMGNKKTPADYEVILNLVCNRFTPTNGSLNANGKQACPQLSPLYSSKIRQKARAKNTSYL